MTDASVSVAAIDSLVLNGQELSSEIAQVTTSAVVERTIDGSSTLSVAIHDDQRVLLRSGILSKRTTAQIDGYTFELVQVKKSGHALTLVLEDLPVASLRKNNSPLKVGAGTVTHVEFAERLVQEEKWLTFSSPASLRNAERTRVEMSRGQPNDSEGEPEDSWAALGRIADERGWRRFVQGSNTIVYAPETYLLEQDPVYTLREGELGVEFLDFDFDSGKPAASVKAKVRAGRWSVQIGSCVEIENAGPVTGKWLVASVSRSLFSLFIDVTLTKARPTLPEPEAASSAAAAGASFTTSANGSVVASESIIPYLFNNSDAGIPDLYRISASYPVDPVASLVKFGHGSHRLIPEAAASFIKVEKAVGGYLPITDSYRSSSAQSAAYAQDPSRYGKPGSSAHNEGRAVDVDLIRFGCGFMSSDPKQWDTNKNWRRLRVAFEAEGWCNFQYKNKTTSGRTSEPWHFSYKVCK